MAAQAVLPAGTLLNGRYRVARVLGSGAFGRVYLAEDVEEPANPPLAIKELLAAEFASSDEQRDAMSWFKREVSALLTLEHPGIPAIHGYWTANRNGGPMYLAMDYVPGKTLADLNVLAGGKLPWPQVVAWGIGLCEVLEYLHSRMPPYIFRDMKPANVLIDERTTAPVLIDFGLARQMVAAGGTAIGTWGYVPFEQVLGKAEPRSDTYSLAAMLHELLTNRHPDVEYRQLLRAGMDVEGALRALFPPVDSLAPGLPPELARTLTQATAFAPEDRFPTAGAMSAALQRVLALADSWPAYYPATNPEAGGAPTSTVRPPTLPLSLDRPPSSTLSQILKPDPPIADSWPTTSLQPSRPEQPPSQHVSPAAPQRPVVPPERQPSGSGSVAHPHTPPTGVAVAQADRQPAPAPHQPIDVPSNGAAASGSAAAGVDLSVAPVPVPPTPITQPLHRPLLPVPEGALPALTPLPDRIVPAPPQATPQVQVPDPTPRRGRWLFRTSAAPATTRLEPGTLVVSSRGQGQFSTISAALRQVPPGGRIQVEPGLYAEALVLDKPVEIVGVGNAEDIVVEAVGAACILMHTERAAVRGITLRCSAGLGEKRYYAVNIPAGQLLLEDCHISSNSLAAVAIHGRSALPTIRRCSIRNGGERALVVYGHGAGLIEGCDIYAATICVRISNHATPTMRRCRIHGGKHGGVSFVEHAQGTLEECDIVDNGHHGVSIRQNSNPVIRRCRIQRNGWTAISVADTSGATVERCDLSGNRSGAWEITEYARLRVLRRDNKEL